MKKALIYSTASLVLIALFVAPSFAQAQTAINVQPPGSVISGNITFNSIVRFIVNLLVVIGIVAALAFLIYGGIRWVMSGGDKNAVEAARNHVTAAIIGLIIVLAAWVIINLVLQLLGVSNGLSNLDVPTIDNPQ